MTWREIDHPRDPRTGEFTEKPGWAGRLAGAIMGRSRWRRVPGRDLTKQVAEQARDIYRESYNRDWTMGDSTIRSIAMRQGWDAKPAVGSSQDLDEAVTEGGTELFRGVRQISNDFGPKDMLRVLQRGGDGLWFGTGIYANGLYTSAAKRTAELFGRGSTFGSFEGGVMRMVLTPEAKIWDWKKGANHARLTSAVADQIRDLRAGMDDEPDYSGHDADGLLDGEITDEIANTLESNLGAVIALQGYDVIRILRSETDNDGGIGADQYVILNPTTLLIQQDLVPSDLE